MEPSPHVPLTRAPDGWSAPAWDQLPAVRSVLGRPIEELLEERPRLQPLDGFEAVYSDFVDYIIRCTHRIWEEKGVGLCRTHYSVDGRVLMLSGISVGCEEVVRNTLTSLAYYPDRSPVGEEVIWSEDAPGAFLSSHRLVSFATNLGDDPAIGTARGRRTGILVIADCLCRDNLIIDEYIVRDNAQLARAFGEEPRQVALRQAVADRKGDQARHGWRAVEIARVRAADPAQVPADHPAAAIVAALHAAFEGQLFDELAALASPSIDIRWPSGRDGVGKGYWIGCLIQLATALTDTAFTVDHWAARPLPGGDVAVAVRWWFTGRHDLPGVWGPPTGREILVLAISHYRLRGGRIVEDMTVFDEVAILRQVEGGLGA